ncbi:hypothetical protein B566_EDAN016182 [Ephemera danica]|nr:hypothetical protein B566_EDAN016182 [Ephemera danica]
MLKTLHEMFNKKKKRQSNYKKLGSCYICGQTATCNLGDNGTMYDICKPHYTEYLCDEKGFSEAIKRIKANRS